MKIKIFSDKLKICEEVAMTLCQAVVSRSNCSLGLATGRTQIPVYKRVVKLAKTMNISFKSVVTFNLDEYIEVPKYNDSSFYSYMKRHLFDHIDINFENVYFPYGDKTKSIQDNISKFENAIEKVGGIDIQLLGLGRNGHIGFNEPQSSRDSTTRVVCLAKETLADNKLDFDDMFLPSRAVTMGVDTIFKAKTIILIATGKKKANALKQMLEGEVGSKCPASFLRAHGNITVFADRDASSLLSQAGIGSTSN